MRSDYRVSAASLRMAGEAERARDERPANRLALSVAAGAICFIMHATPVNASVQICLAFAEKVVQIQAMCRGEDPEKASVPVGYCTTAVGEPRVKSILHFSTAEEVRCFDRLFRASEQEASE